MKIFRSAGNFLILLLLCSTQSIFAQNASASTETPPFKRNPTVPPFVLTSLDGKTITRESLAKKKATLIIYFSPECHHCIDQMNEMVKQAKSFEPYNLVFATYQPMEELQKFYTKYNLSTWKNIYLGRDEKFFFPPYCKIANLPFNILYDKKGNLITSFEGTTAMDKLLNGLAGKN